MTECAEISKQDPLCVTNTNTNSVLLLHRTSFAPEAPAETTSEADMTHFYEELLHVIYFHTEKNSVEYAQGHNVWLADVSTDDACTCQRHARVGLVLT